MNKQPISQHNIYCYLFQMEDELFREQCVCGSGCVTVELGGMLVKVNAGTENHAVAHLHMYSTFYSQNLF